MVQDLDKRVEFNDDYVPRSSYTHEEAPGIVKLIIKYSGGLIKNENQAEIYLAVFSVIIIIISLFIAFHKNNNKETPFTPAANAPVQSVKAN